jgi:hypothetical protein
MEINFISPKENLYNNGNKKSIKNSTLKIWNNWVPRNHERIILNTE